MNKVKSVIFAVVFCTSLISSASNEIIITPPLAITPNSETVASIENGIVRLSYLSCGEGNNALACSMQTKIEGTWTHYISPMEDNKVFVITGGKKIVHPNYKNYFPAWKTEDDEISTNPFLSGSVCEAVPIKARNLDKNRIEVEYVTKGNHQVKGVWSLKKNSCFAELTLQFTPSASGCYSLGVMALHAALPHSVSNVLLPPMNQYRRIPETNEMLLSSMMPTPVSMVETEMNSKRVTAFASADDNMFPLDWGSVDYSPIGFALKNHDGLVEPVAFSPVLGMYDCEMTAGKQIVKRFIIGLSSEPWNKTLEYVADNIYNLKDYRKQTALSLTETIFNIVDLMNNDEYGGWDNEMKGPYDIEGKPTKAPVVVHSAPLAIIETAINSGDEDMYVKRALPAIEYTLSRKGYRWSTQTTDEGYNKDPETLRLSPFDSQFTTTYYDGLNTLLGGKNRWLEKIALPGGDIRTPRGYSTPILSWVQSLAAYRLTGDKKWLDKATSTADRDANLHIFKNSEKPMRYQAFYNSTMYAPWWDFVDLFEVTGDKKYLEAAQYGSAQTMAGIRVWPQVNDSTQTIHAGNKYNGNATMWWKGMEQFRLGFPRTDGDAPQHDVEQWLVSPVGLGFEQPSTYFLRTKGKPVRPVFMSSWAPSFLRLNMHTGNDLYDKYARNAVLGRFTNYPGYYATGYTDLTMSEEFPYKGPDVSSIYYHHIPPHLAFTTDYLVSEMIQRSNGKVKFPYGKQEGFVWFSNRVYGGSAGSVFDDKNVSIWMKKGLITSSEPQINYVTAVSPNSFYILLANESLAETETTLRLGNEIKEELSLSSAKCLGEKISKNMLNIITEDVVSVKLKPKGFCVVSIPVKSTANNMKSAISKHIDKSFIPELKEGFKMIDSGTRAGRIFTFRIRSPFGWDSIYLFCETPPCDDLSVEFITDNHTQTLNKYPYEYSLIKLEPSKKINIKVNIKDGSDITKSHEIEI